MLLISVLFFYTSLCRWGQRRPWLFLTRNIYLMDSFQQAIEDTFNKLLGAVYKHLGAPGKLFRGLDILNYLGRILRLWLKTMESLPELQF